MGKVIHRKIAVVNCVERNAKLRFAAIRFFHKNTRASRVKIVDNVDKKVDNSYAVPFSVDNLVDVRLDINPVRWGV